MKILNKKQAKKTKRRREEGKKQKTEKSKAEEKKRESKFRNSVKESEVYVLCDPIDSLNTDYDVLKRSDVYPTPNMPLFGSLKQERLRRIRSSTQRTRM